MDASLRLEKRPLLNKPIIEQKANVAQSAGAQCAPLRARRRNAQLLFFRNIVGARIARPLLEFVQNFGFAHLLKEYAANAPRLKVGFIIAYLEWVSKHARFMTKSEENLKKSVDSGFEICYNHLRQRHKFIGELCNGSTYDSDSYCLGSNPSSPAI